MHRTTFSVAPQSPGSRTLPNGKLQRRHSPFDDLRARDHANIHEKTMADGASIMLASSIATAARLQTARCTAGSIPLKESSSAETPSSPQALPARTVHVAMRSVQNNRGSELPK
eukprot:6196791-Pleurochrysis_carterae.AAC.3